VRAGQLSSNDYRAQNSRAVIEPDQNQSHDPLDTRASVTPALAMMHLAIHAAYCLKRSSAVRTAPSPYARSPKGLDCVTASNRTNIARSALDVTATNTIPDGDAVCFTQ
jgi:hypothetical protein